MKLFPRLEVNLIEGRYEFLTKVFCLQKTMRLPWESSTPPSSFKTISVVSKNGRSSSPKASFQPQIHKQWHYKPVCEHFTKLDQSKTFAHICPFYVIELK